jgi:hypothetical protein
MAIAVSTPAVVTLRALGPAARPLEYKGPFFMAPHFAARMARHRAN